MNAYDIIEELCDEYGSLLLLAAYIKRETKCSVDTASELAYELDGTIERMLNERSYNEDDEDDY